MLNPAEDGAATSPTLLIALAGRKFEEPTWYSHFRPENNSEGLNGLTTEAAIPRSRQRWASASWLVEVSIINTGHAFGEFARSRFASAKPSISGIWASINTKEYASPFAS